MKNINYKERIKEIQNKTPCHRLAHLKSFHCSLTATIAKMEVNPMFEFLRRLENR